MQTTQNCRYACIYIYIYTSVQCTQVQELSQQKRTQRKRRRKAIQSKLSFFGEVGVAQWLSTGLPQDLRHCSTLSSFKAKLKTFLFSQYFHPNIHQYPVSASHCVCVCLCVCVCVRACMRVCVCSAFFFWYNILWKLFW